MGEAFGECCYLYVEHLAAVAVQLLALWYEG